MNYQSAWSYPLPDSIYNLAQSQSPFATNVSNYFRRPAKVVKPSSRSTSPRHLGRRRTATTSGNVSLGRTRSVLDKQRPTVQQQYINQSRSRPLSWHPNTYPDFNPSLQDSSFFISHDTYQQPNFYGTAAANGQYTPLTQPITDEPQIHELITPLEGLSAQEMGQAFDESAYSNTYWLPQDMSKQQYAMDAMFPQSTHLQIPTWHWNNSFGQELPTAPSSPNFLPIQGAIDASPLDLNTKISPPSKTDGEELVAMGLYDSPAEVQSSSLLFGGGSIGSHGPSRKRSLKLEEAWEPAERSEQEEQETDASGEDDDEAAVSEPDESSVSSFPILQNYHPEQAHMTGPSTMAGQSFFFDEMPLAPSFDPLNGQQQQREVYSSPIMSYVTGSSGTGLPIQGAGYGWF